MARKWYPTPIGLLVCVILAGVFSLWLARSVLGPKSESGTAGNGKTQSADGQTDGEDGDGLLRPIDLPVVKLYRVSRKHFSHVLPVLGTIRGLTSADLAFEIEGVVKSFRFHEGDIIKQGEIISELDHHDMELKVKFMEAKLQGAKTRLLAAQRKVEIHEQLYNIQAIIEQKFDEVRLEYENTVQELKAAQIEVESSKSELSKTYLFAPKDGVLKSKDVEIGERVNPNIKTCTIVTISEVYVEMGIIERRFKDIFPDLAVKVRVDSYPDREFIGQIEKIHPDIDRRTGMITVEARLSNPESLLLPGMFARTQILITDEENAVVIPAAALRPGQGGSGTWSVITVVPGQNTVEAPKEVVVADYTVDEAMIEEGLEDGMLVVIESTKEELEEGQRVDVAEIRNEEQAEGQDAQGGLAEALKGLGGGS